MSSSNQPSPGEAIFPLLRGRALLVIILLVAVNAANFIDRQLPFILIESIKRDLRLTDGQVGLMAGLGFAVVFSCSALILARVADRWSERHMVALTLGVWSLMTTLSGLANSFGAMFAARLGVAASEAGCNPAAHAYIARAFAPDRRAFILALFSLGVPIGSMTGLVLGGWINDAFGWRTAFLLVGTPGLLLAIAAWLAMPSLPRPTEGVQDTGMLMGFRLLFGMRTFRHMAAGCGLYACGSYAMNVFASAFLIRIHGLSAAQAGLGFGITFGVGGLVGTLLGGLLADTLGKRAPRWRLLIPAVGQLLSLPTLAAAWLVSDALASIVLIGFGYAFGLLFFAPTFAVAQSLAPDHMRASASALLGFCLTLAGASIGPTVVGWASDWLRPTYGVESLRYALSLMSITIMLSAWQFFAASRHAARDLARS